MPSERFDRGQDYDGHRRSGGGKKRAGRRQRVRRSIAQVMREIARDWAWTQGGKRQ